MVRTKLLHHEKPHKDCPFEAISVADIYNYCIPYGIDPANNQHAKSPESLTSHLRNCPTCLTKMQQLHTTIYTIAERADSEIVTRFTLKGQIEEAAVEPEHDDLYSNWPINVQELDKSMPAPAISTEPMLLPQELKQRIAALNLKQFIKPIAAAAIILIGVLLLFNVPAVKAVGLSQIYETLEKVQSVCISRFVPDKPEPTQKVWVSRSLNLKMYESKEEFVLYDIQNKARKIKRLSSGLITTTPVSEDLLAQTKESMEGALGLVPFSDISAIPKGAQWTRVNRKDLETIVPGTEVYDLTWSETGTKGVYTRYRIWRVFVDIDTKLPKRTESYRKMNPEEEYEFYRFVVITYHSESEIKAFIQNVFD
jgi:hypothetical protein